MREQHAKRDVSVRGGFSDSRFASLSINGELASRLVENPGGTLHIKGVGMLIVSLRDLNFGFLSHLGCSGQNAIIFSSGGLV